MSAPLPPRPQSPFATRLGSGLVPDMDQHELACRIAEATLGLQRPAGVTAVQALSVFAPEDRTGFYRAATAALSYLFSALADVSPQFSLNGSARLIARNLDS